MGIKIKRLILVFLFVLLPVGMGATTAFLCAQENADEQNQQEEETISLDLKGVEITELLRIISTKTGKTIVPSNAVKGRVNIFLNNVKLEDALDIILFTQKLACDKKGDILYVLTAVEYRSMYGKEYVEKREYKNIKLNFAEPANVFTIISELKSDIGKIIVDGASGSIILLDIPEKLVLMEGVIKQLDMALETQVFDINYASVAEIKTQLESVLTAGVGQVIVDERSSKVIVSDLPSKMERIKKIVRNFDEEDRQVFIEAEIIQITLADTFKRGINWEKIFGDSGMDNLDFTSTFPVSPTLATSGQVSVGVLSDDRYNVVLQLLKTYGDVKILSRPRIAVLNNEEARILVGTKDAYISNTLSQAEATTVTSEDVEFIEVGVKLNVKPTINKDGFVTMKIKPEVSSVSEIITTSAGSRIPIVETSEAETVVRVKDGATIMIAGLMKRDKRDTFSGVPLLSDLPVIGEVFSTRSQEDTQTELIIFISPHIISGEAPLRGTGIENFMPAEMLPEEMKKEIMLKEIEKIKISPEAGIVLEDKGRLKSEEYVEQDQDFRDRLKGLKEY